MKVLLKVIKNIFCVEEYTENCNKCSLCHLIDLNNLPSLKIIEPDGNFIKKEQIIELKHFFAKESQFTKENIYVIKNCEKMNKDSANTMLKFLEEPDGSVIGFFITNHEDNVISTIQSRCQHISINFDNENYENFNILEEKYNEYIKLIKEYLFKIEVDKKESILNNKKYLADYSKEEIKIIFQIILQIYNDILHSRYKKVEILNHFDFLNNFSTQNIMKKIKLVIEFLKELNYNLNLDLSLDRFVIEMEGINSEII